MIVPMKKIAVLVQEKDSKAAVGTLRRLGVVHVQNSQTPQGERVRELREDIALLDAALSILAEEKFVKAAGNAKQEAAGDWRFVCKHVIDLEKHLQQLEEYSLLLKSQMDKWQQWGDFNPDAIRSLAGKNIFIRLYEIPSKELEMVPVGIIVKNVFTSAGLAHCVVISRENMELPFKEVALPKLGLLKMRERLFEDARMMGIIKDDICKHTSVRENLRVAQKNLEKELEFDEALTGMGQDGLITYLTGFVPIHAADLIKQQAQQEHWGLIIKNPLPGDNVPTLLKNPRWITLISPVLNLLGILPGYAELDVSFLFLVFFSIFFGILIGDAGYGLIYLAFTFFLQRKRRLKESRVYGLFYVLSSCAIIWGILTGNFFGQVWLAKVGVKPLVPALNNPKVMQTVCFFIGALHLSIAHSWRLVLKLPSLSALSDFGWICILWSAFFFARMLILGDYLPGFVIYLLYAGIASVIIFTNPQKNILKGIGEGLGTLALGLMNNFTDVVSYIRLFAVGMAGLAIAETSNAMAGGLTGNPIIAVIVVPLVLIIGHALNLILGPISVLVHGVRLNVLEFSGHAGVSWSGSMYRPLREKEGGL